MIELYNKVLQNSNNSSSQVAQIKNISFSSPDKQLFSNVDLIINKRDNIATMGKSGVGKSTLIKILLKKILPDIGTVNINSGIKISYVPQNLIDLKIDSNTTIKDLFYNARGLTTINYRKSQLETLMGIENNSKLINPIIKEYGELCEQFEKIGGYSADSEIDFFLSGLRLDKKTTGHINYSTKLNQVSSGQKTRLLIGQALFAHADLLIMDDPTSHLDIVSIKWLADYLKYSKSASFIATNNISFIEGFSNKVVEITDFGRVLSFNGSYKSYVIKRDRLLLSEKLQADAINNEHDRIQATYLHFKSRQIFKKSANMAQVGRALQSRIGRLDAKYNNLPGSKQIHIIQKTKSLIFKSKTRSGDDVMLINGVSKSYDNFVALNLISLSLSIKRGEHLLISGENGTGKSTLMRIIFSTINKGLFQSDTGNITVGSGIRAGLYSPDDSNLSIKGSVLEEIKMSNDQCSESEAVSTLIYWGIPKLKIRTKQLEQLSPGEKKQVSLAKLMVQQPNLLLLDEPTDYLKSEIIDQLIYALTDYDGTLIVISHNQEFVKQLSFHYELKLPEGKLITK